MRTLACAAGLLLLMGGVAWAQSDATSSAVAAALPVPVRTGEHPGFGRVVFDLPAGATWTLDRSGDRLTVRFSGADPLPGARPPRNVRALTAAAGTAELLLVPGAQVRSMRLGNLLVVDLLDPAGAPAAERPALGVSSGARLAAAPPASALPKAAPNGGQRAAVPPGPAQAGAIRQAAMGDQFGGRVIPREILKILADPRIEPVVAYVVWQAARKPLEEWTVRQLQEITSMLPTLTETGMPMPQIQALYKFLGLDPEDVFNPQLGQDWQSRSTSFDANSAAAVAAISSADCQTDPGQMTVATFQSCQSGGQ